MAIQRGSVRDTLMGRSAGRSNLTRKFSGRGPIASAAPGLVQ